MKPRMPVALTRADLAHIINALPDPEASARLGQVVHEARVLKPSWFNSLMQSGTPGTFDGAKVPTVDEGWAIHPDQFTVIPFRLVPLLNKSGERAAYAWAPTVGVAIVGDDREHLSGLEVGNL